MMSPPTEFLKVWPVLWLSWGNVTYSCHKSSSWKHMRCTGILLKALRGLAVKKSISIASFSAPQSTLYITPTRSLCETSAAWSPSGNTAPWAKLLSLLIQFTPFPSRQSLPGRPHFTLLIVLHEGTTFYFSRSFSHSWFLKTFSLTLWQNKALLMAGIPHRWLSFVWTLDNGTVHKEDFITFRSQHP